MISTVLSPVYCVVDALQVTPGILQAPVGKSVSVASMHMTGAKVLLAWNEGLASLVRTGLRVESLLYISNSVHSHSTSQLIQEQPICTAFAMYVDKDKLKVCGLMPVACRPSTCMSNV